MVRTGLPNALKIFDVSRADVEQIEVNDLLFVKLLVTCIKTFKAIM